VAEPVTAGRADAVIACLKLQIFLAVAHSDLSFGGLLTMLNIATFSATRRRGCTVCWRSARFAQTCVNRQGRYVHVGFVRRAAVIT
jgi:hypothetical protein